MTITQFGASGVETDYFYDGEIETFFGTDFGRSTVILWIMIVPTHMT